MKQKNTYKRVVIEGVTPEINAGRFPVKRIRGDMFEVEADIYADNYDELSAVLLWKKEGAGRWRETAMIPLVNDRWRAAFRLDDVGRYRYTLKAWIDPFKTWIRDLRKRLDAGQDVSIDLLIGAGIVAAAAERAKGRSAVALRKYADMLADESSEERRVKSALDERLARTMQKCCRGDNATSYENELTVAVDPPRARFSAWYEVFPRSCSPEPGRYGAFRDLEMRLPYIAEMGFDVLYLPPIHPIGRTLRKGSNNVTDSGPGEPGSPWGIGSEDGGHKAIHHRLGTFGDFRRLISEAGKYGMEIALDIAFQSSPDHPYVRDHPQWFRKRPDGSIQYAENPPKKYQDIFPFDFDTADWRALWNELRSIFEFWIGQGVTIFRVDNPHTKPFDFWEWCIGDIKKKHPGVILLSEAFTRPKIMYRLAKIGFSQSYSYFPWRILKWELTQYFEELTQAPVSEFFRPSHWTNTPDILIEFLQKGGRPAFMIRFILAATLGANYGIYGPAFETCENRPLKEGSEEYLNSEKYQIRHWDLDHPRSIRRLIGVVNRIRRENQALQNDRSLRFHGVDNEQLICYSKADETRENVILVVVNLDPKNVQAGTTQLRMDAIGLDWNESFVVHDLLTDARYPWNGERNYVELDPARMPAHIFRIIPQEPVKEQSISQKDSQL